MYVYIIVFFLSLLLSLSLPANSDWEWKRKLFWTFLPLFVFGALRVDFGNDYQGYVNYFNEFHTKGPFVFDESSHAEIGFQLLCYLMPTHRSVLVLNSLLLCLAFALFIYHNVPKHYMWVAIVIIFLNVEKNIYGSMVGLRNGFAVTAFLLGSIYIQKRKLIPFALITLISMSFHTSAFFYLPIAYLVGRGKEISKGEIYIWIATLTILGTMSSVGLLNALTPFLMDNFERYEVYIIDFTGHQGILMVTTTIVLFVLIFTLFYENRKILSNEQNSLCRLGLLYVASLFMGTISMRAGYFYNVFFAGTIALLFSLPSKYDTMRKALCVVAIIMSAYSMYLWMHAGHVLNNPLYTVYHSILTI